MVKALIFLTILVDLISISKSCHPDWYNRCRVNAQCCSGFCDKPPHWADGLCRPNRQGSNCLGEWNNQCRNNQDCCSVFCYKPGDWSSGICRNRGSCMDDWYNRCKTGSDCCSNNCYRPHSWEFGVCYPPQEFLDRIGPCSTSPRNKRALAYVCREVFRPCKSGYRRIVSASGERTDLCKKVY